MFGSANAVTNLAALATTGLALAGAPGHGVPAGGTGRGGPDSAATLALHDGSRFRIDLGFGDRFRRDDHRHDARIEVAPRRLELKAYHVGDQVLVIAEGDNRSGGFTTFLERCDDHRRFGGATLVLRNLGPARGHFGSQAITCFEITGSLNSRSCPTEVKVWVAGQVHCVPVKSVHSIRR